MTPDETARRLAEEVATTLKTQLELAKPVTVTHEFNGLRKYIAAGIFAALGWLALQVFNEVRSKEDTREVFARELAHQAQAAQTERDRRQDEALSEVTRNLTTVGTALTALNARLEANQEHTKEYRARVERLEDRMQVGGGRR